MSNKNNPMENIPHQHKWVFSGINIKSIPQKPQYTCAVCGKKR